MQGLYQMTEEKINNFILKFYWILHLILYPFAMYVVNLDFCLSKITMIQYSIGYIFGAFIGFYLLKIFIQLKKEL